MPGEAISLDPEILPLEAWKAAHAEGGGSLWPASPAVRVDVRSPSGTKPIHGRVPLDIELGAPPGTEIRQVDVALSGRVVYSGTGAPAGDAIDTRSFPDGEHTLTVKVRTSEGRAAAYLSRLSIENARRLADELQPPINTGLFGVIQRRGSAGCRKGSLRAVRAFGSLPGAEDGAAGVTGTRWFRVTVRGAGPAFIQLGRLELNGMKE